MGKSWSAMTFCKLVDPNFCAENIAFNEEQFLALLNKEMPSGSAILFDEAGVGLDNRDAMTFINKLITYVTQTMGHRNQLVVLTVPNKEWVDVKVQSILNFTFDMVERPNAQTKLSCASMFSLQKNRFTGKIYNHYLTVMKSRYPYTIAKSYFHKPDDLLLEEYEIRKKQFTKELFTNGAIEIAERNAPKAKRNTMLPKDIVGYIEANKKSVTDGRNRVNMSKLVMDLNLGTNKAATVKRFLVGQGYKMAK